MNELDEMREDQPKAPATNLLAPVESDVVMLDETADADTLLQTYETVKFYLQELKRLKLMIEAAMMGKIKASGPLVISPTVRYVIAIDKVTKCKDVAGAVNAVLDATGGDLGALNMVLSANAIKHGAAKKVLPPEVWGKYFEVVVKESLEEDGKKKEKLLKVDEKFMR